jgi:hypothetical protein
MPTTVQVKINTVQHTTQTSKAGNDLNYVEITGFDATNNKGFKKRFFATKKDGTATKNAETADSLNQDDWAEITLDDTSYHNVQTLKKIQQPAGMQAPSQASPESGNPGKGNKGGYKPNPEKEKAIAKSVALKASVTFFAGSQEVGAEDIIEMAYKFVEFLTPEPAVDGEVRQNLVETAPNGNTIQTPAPTDDDIPF